MYRCQVCRNVSRPGQHLLRYTVYRSIGPRTVKRCVNTGIGIRTIDATEGPRREIEREVALCETCHSQIEEGATFNDVLLQRGYMVKSINAPIESTFCPPSIPESLIAVVVNDKGMVVSGKHKVDKRRTNSLNGTPRPSIRKAK